MESQAKRRKPKSNKPELGDIVDKVKKAIDIPIDYAAVRLGLSLVPIAGYYEGLRYLSTLPTFYENPTLHGAAIGAIGVPLAFGLYKLNANDGLFTRLANKTLESNKRAYKSTKRKGVLSYLKTTAIASLAAFFAYTGCTVKSDYDSGNLFKIPQNQIETNFSPDPKQEEIIIGQPNTETNPQIGMVTPDVANPKPARIFPSITDKNASFDYLSIFEGATPQERTQIQRRIDVFKGKYQSQSGIQALKQVLETLVLLEPIIDKEAKSLSLDPLMLKYVLAIENGGEFHAVSSASCIGPMQLSYGTFTGYGGRIRKERIVDTNTGKSRLVTVYDERYDPRINIHIGARYLEDLIKGNENLGRADLAVLAYNQGPYQVLKMIRDFVRFVFKESVPKRTLDTLNRINSHDSVEIITPEFVDQYDVSMWDLVNLKQNIDKYLRSSNGGRTYLTNGVGIVQLAREADKYGVDLKIPTYDELFSQNYEVKSGETLAEIARRSNLSLSEFLNVNQQFRVPDHARPGDHYKLPKMRNPASEGSMLVARLS